MIENLFKVKEKNYVLVRTYSAGVWFGELLEKEDKEVILQNGRMLWSWRAKNGISLAEIGLFGLHKDSKVCSPVKVLLTEVIQIIEPTKEAIESMVNFPVFEP